MRYEVLGLALIVGAVTWAFRYFPLRATQGDIRPDGLLGRLLAATGPAAIAALFVAEVMPFVQMPLARQLPLAMGIAAVVGVFAWRRSVVLATIAGSLAFGTVWALTVV